MSNSITQLPCWLQCLHYDGLWCYIGGCLDVNDDRAKEIAHACMDQGITTWQQFSELDANEIASMIHKYI